MVVNRYSVLDIEDDDNRSQAFKILSDKDKLKNELYRTTMCNKKNCDRVNCNYAHNDCELRIRKCLFGNDCIYKHSKNKRCKYIHPDETKESYEKRIDCCIKIKKIKL